jgi:hypothetical protein
MLSLTTGGPEETFTFNGRNADIDLLLWPINFTLYYVGYEVLEPFVAFGVEGGLKYSSQDEAIRRLDRAIGPLWVTNGPSAAPPRRSVPGGIAEEIRAKAEVTARMSVVGGRAEVDFRRLDVGL